MVAAAVDNYPDLLKGCGVELGSLGAALERGVTRHLILRLGATVGSRMGGGGCPLPGAPGIPVGPGMQDLRLTVDEAHEGSRWVSTDLELALDPFPNSVLSLRPRLGGGRVWDRKLWQWSAGADLVYRAGRHELLVAAILRSFRFGVRRELIEYDEDLEPVLLESEEFTESGFPLFLQVGYRLRFH